MAINKNTILNIYKNAIDGSQYLLLQLIGTQIDITELLLNLKIKGTILMLEKKQLIEKISSTSYQLTSQGTKLFEQIGDISPISINTVDNSVLKSIYEKIENKIKEITGKSQILNPSGKYFKPSLKVFKLRMAQFFKKFNVSDIENVEKALLLYTEKVCRNQIKYPVALLYFIWNEKNKTEQSELLEWMEQINEIDYDGTNI